MAGKHDNMELPDTTQKKPIIINWDKIDIERFKTLNKILRDTDTE